jgi:hypothetical protein
MELSLSGTTHTLFRNEKKRKGKNAWNYFACMYRKKMDGVVMIFNVNGIEKGRLINKKYDNTHQNH